jgi:hypothetical protein
MVEWFIDRIETFAPATWRQERQQLYTDLLAIPSAPMTSPYDHVGLFVLAHVSAARHVAVSSGPGSPRRGRSAHETWYSKERQRIAKMLQQITESPVVAAFHTTIHYYAAAAVTCPHGRNQKTCATLYGLRLTLSLLERYPALRGVRKQVERLRHLEPHLPLLQDLCQPQVDPDPGAVPCDLGPADSANAFDDGTLYLLGTVVSRLRQAGLTVAQSCDLVDRILSWCFDQPDPEGVRPAALAEQWRRLC